MNLQRLYRLSFDTPPTAPTAPVVESERRPTRPPARPLPRGQAMIEAEFYGEPTHSETRCEGGPCVVVCESLTGMWCEVLQSVLPDRS